MVEIKVINLLEAATEEATKGEKIPIYRAVDKVVR